MRRRVVTLDGGDDAGGLVDVVEVGLIFDQPSALGVPTKP